MLRASVLASMLIAASARGADEHMVCLASDGVFHYKQNCSDREGLRSSVEPSSEERRFLWASRSQHGVAVGVLPPNATSVDPIVNATCCMIATPTAVVAPDGEDATVTLTGETAGSWTFTLDSWWFREGRLNIVVPRDNYRLRITTVKGKVLLDRSGFNLRRDERGAGLHLKGHVFSRDSKSVAEAQVTVNCRRVICTTDAEGRFDCTVREPRVRAICVEHPEHGRIRVEVADRSGNVQLGQLTLEPGAVIRVIRPLHLELPEGTTVALRRQGRDVRPPQPLDGRDEMEIGGLDAGRYEVVLAGPEPLQRRAFPVEVTDRGLAEVYLSLDAYRLTGDVTHRERPLANATVDLTGEHGQATLRTDASGRFATELWAPDSFGVLISAPALAQPWGVMKRASLADNDWHLTIPSRTINGRVVDRSSGRGVESARVAIESNTQDGTRWSRTIKTDEKGAFEITGVSEGRYELSASHDAYVPSDRQEVVVGEASGNPGVTLTMETGVDVSIHVVDTAGVAMEAATVLADFSPAGKANRIGRTDAAGLAILRLRSKSSVDVFVLGRSGSFVPVRVTADREAKEVRVMAPDPVGALELVAISADDSRPLTGLVVALRYNGQLVPRDVLFRLAAGHGGSVVTDAAGRIHLPALQAGAYEFAFATPAQSTRPVWQRVDVGRGTSVVTQRLTVRESTREQAGVR